MLYKINEGTIEISNAYKDRSVNIINIEGLPISNVNIVITRDPLPINSDLENQVEIILNNFKEKLSSFDLKRHEKGPFDGNPSQFLEVSWVDKGKFISQLILYIENNGIIICIAATALGGMDDQTRQELMKYLQSFKFEPSLKG